jgi:hypothetical protein
VLRLYPGRVHCPDIGKQHGKAARVVAHARRIEPSAFAAHLHVRSFREDRIEMRGDDDDRAAGGAGAAAQAHRIAFAVYLHIGKASLGKHLPIGFRPRLLLERAVPGFR